MYGRLKATFLIVSSPTESKASVVFHWPEISISRCSSGMVHESYLNPRAPSTYPMLTTISVRFTQTLASPYRLSHSSSFARNFGATSTHTKPLGALLPRKISAKDSPIIARIGQPTKAQTACSREEPQPKFSPTTRIVRPLFSGKSKGCSPLLFALSSSKTWGPKPDMVSHFMYLPGMIWSVSTLFPGERQNAFPSTRRIFPMTNTTFLFRYPSTRPSTILPAAAEATTEAGDIKMVRPVGLPCLPTKFRFEVETQSSRPTSLSGFIARPILHPGSPHRNPAC